MRIKSINIRNFRGFAQKYVEFNGNLTVVIGNNTAGKTSILKAIQIGLGEFLQDLPTLPGGPAYRRNFTNLDRYKPFDAIKRDYIPNIENPRIEIVADCNLTMQREGVLTEEHRTIRWAREYVRASYTTHNTRTLASEMMDFATELSAIRRGSNTNVVFPIVLSFGAKRTEDAQYRVVKKVKERLSREEKAYKMALHDKVDYDGAIDWLKHYDKNVKDGREFMGTREAFFEALQTAIPALSEIDFDDNEIEAVVTITGMQPTRHHFSYMSDGLQSMINIVSEIAHRCIELNGFLGEDAVKKTPGVIMIDELDLYLHPHWQRHILADLMAAFPEIQFIVSTHSPFIIQSLKQNQLVSFDEGVDVSGEPFKDSIEDIAESRMGMQQELRAKRYQEMLKKAEQYYMLVKSGQYQQAEQVKDELDAIEAEYSDDPAYVALLRSERKSTL